jgi:putative Mg2+ transporter-C (MgtC) family protein
MTGVGFLGAGAIMHVGWNVRGLTTAAGMWCVAAVGLAFGSGLYLIGITATLLVLIVLWLLQEVETDFARRYIRRLTIRAPFSHTVMDEMNQRFGDKGVRVLDSNYRRNVDKNTVDLVLEVAFSDQRQAMALERDLLTNTQITLIAAERI